MQTNPTIIIHVEGGMVQTVFLEGRLSQALCVKVLDLDLSGYPDKEEQEEHEGREADLISLVDKCNKGEAEVLY